MEKDTKTTEAPKPDYDAMLADPKCLKAVGVLFELLRQAHRNQQAKGQG